MAKRLIPPEKAVIIRVSERQKFRECRRAWKYAYLNKLEPIAKSPGARELGTALHAALAAYYRAMALDSAVESREGLMWDAWESYMTTLETEQIELGTGMLNNYLRTYDQDDLQNLKPLLVEETLYAPILGTKVWLQGTIDLLVDVRGEGTFIMDSKSYRSMRTSIELEHEDQMTAYIWLCQQNGIRVRGAIYNQLRKAVPAIPRVLKNGTLSRDRGMGTDKTTYLQAIKDNGFNPDDYADFLELLGDGEFFSRVTIYRSKEYIEEFQRWLPFEAREMSSIRTPLYPNLSLRHCNFCDFSSMCVAECNRADVKLVARLEYQKKEDKSTCPAQV